MEEFSLLYKQNRFDTIKDRSYYVWERKSILNTEFTEKTEGKVNIYLMNNRKYSKEEIKELLNNIKYREAFFHFVSFYECLAKGIIDEFYDYEIIKSLGKDFLIQLYDNVLSIYLLVCEEETSNKYCTNFVKLIKEFKNDKKSK